MGEREAVHPPSKPHLPHIHMDKIRAYCKVCKRKTLHIKRGFGIVGGLLGNARLDCLECEEEKFWKLYSNERRDK